MLSRREAGRHRALSTKDRDPNRANKMGVPAFYRWLSEKYPKIVVDMLEDRTVRVEGTEIPLDLTAENPNGIEVSIESISGICRSLPTTPCLKDRSTSHLGPHQKKGLRTRYYVTCELLGCFPHKSIPSLRFVCRPCVWKVSDSVLLQNHQPKRSSRQLLRFVLRNHCYGFAGCVGVWQAQSLHWATSFH